MNIRMVILLIVVGALALQAQAATITSRKSGNWSNSSTWFGNHTPTSSDDVVIQSGHTVDLDADITIQSLTIAGTLRFDSRSQTLTVYGDWLRTGTFSPGSRVSVVLAGTGTVPITPTDFYNLTVEGAYSVDGNFLISNVLSIPGYFSVGSSVINLDGSGNCMQVSGTFDYGTSTVNFYRDGNQNIAAIAYYHLRLSTESNPTNTNRYTKTAQGYITCYGDLTVDSYCTLAMGSNQIDVQGSLVHVGTGNTDSGYITWQSGTTPQGTIRFFGSGNSYITPNSRNSDNDIHNMTVQKNTNLDTVKLASVASHVVGVVTGGAMRFLSGVFDYTDMRLSPEQTDFAASVYVAPGAIVRAGEDNFPFNRFTTTGYVPHNVPSVTVSDGSLLEFYCVANSSQTKYIRGSEANIASYGTVRILGGGQKLLSGNVRINDTLVVHSNTAVNLNSRVLSFGSNGTLRYLLSDSTGAGFQAGQTTTNSEFPTSNGPSLLMIDNPLNVTLHANRTLGRGMTFQSGKLILGASTLTIGATGGIQNAHSSCYVVTNGNGYLKRNGLGVSPTIFPVGPNTTSYNPASLALVGSSDNFSLRVSETITPAPGDPTQAVARMWTVMEDSPGGSAGTLSLQWDASAEGSNFHRTDPVSINQFITDWVEKAATVSGSNPYTASSPFTTYSNFIVTSGAPLPVELVAFSGAWVEGKVLLSWKTASEYQCIGFQIEKSNEGDWTSIGFVPGHWYSMDPHEYEFLDPLSENIRETARYRLKQLDQDGGFAYSPIVTMEPRFHEEAPRISDLYPSHPSMTAWLTVQLMDSEPLRIVIFNALGRMVYADALPRGLGPGYHSIALDVRSLPAGWYRVVAATTSGLVQKSMLVLR